MPTLEFHRKGEKFAVDFEFEIPLWYKQFFFETCAMYQDSCSNDVPICSDFILPILKKFFSPREINPFIKRLIPAKAIEYDFNENKLAIAFSGGKDCVYMLIKMLEKIEPKNIVCLYLPNINKSESFYEKKAVSNICKKLGVQHHIIPVRNSIKLNRVDHNIGLREQLIAGICLPYMIQFGAPFLHYGIKGSATGVELKTDDQDIFSLYEEMIDVYCPEIYLTPYSSLSGTTDYEISKIMATKHREILDLTSSCYTQMNFREKRHYSLSKKFPDIKIYNGCGLCQKCMIINGAIVNTSEKSKHHDEWVSFYFKRYKTKFQNNTNIKQAYEEMIT